MSGAEKIMTPPPAARAPPLRGIREGEEKNAHLFPSLITLPALAGRGKPL